MITKTSFKKLLEYSDFTLKNNVYQKKIKGALLQADFEKEKLIYPKGIKVEGDFTLNFLSNENFVVFECVHRLLTVGYKPEHLTLEPKWKLGHGASGGRADIVIRNNEQKVFAIIECKTAGKEFKDAWELGLQYPSQLFSYAQQEGSTKCICLYTSDFSDKSDFQYYVIPLIDNESALGTSDDDEPVLTYTKATRFDEKFNVWKYTYNQEYDTKGFFEEDIQPFHLGRKNYSINDLKEIDNKDIQHKYHEFATILRKYNVSGRENAFDKLVNLFLCKLVDEKENPTNLKFYWRGMAYDSHFDLQDRLQLLYQQGMKQFLNEEVTYINQEQIDEAFRFLEEDPDATKETINRYFKQLKFYTNNDFAIIDVHNERLFKQNAEILKEIVQMLQGIRLKSESDEHHNQFLGDMFEGFLDAGVKQSEGQFFTPMPIVKFIVNSLPLQQAITENDHPPKAIDYACGAGHFLTELARQIKPLVNQYKKAAISDYYTNITGIEKEYRLSKVAKVSAFMYGQDEIKIMYADALAKNPEIKNGIYNILVANPPYSVKGFLETLTMPEKRSYELFGNIDDKSVITNNSIETFFIERAKQLLAPEGVAAIILPSSILSNDAKIYQQTREILIQHFHIIAIAELGSGTFGKTGTNTVTLFLRRRQINPSEADHYRNRAYSWIEEGRLNPNERKNKEFKDLYLLEDYCKHIGIDYNDFENYFQNTEANESLQKTELWQEYEKSFYARTDIKNHQKKPLFKNLNAVEQKKELNVLLYRHIREIEKEKVYYYLLAKSNAAPVLIIKSPSENKAMKKFLGYEWSAAKGSEGIKYLHSPQPLAENDDEPTLITAMLNSIQTPLYNPIQADDVNKLNYYIQENFLGKTFVLPESLKVFAHTSRLTDMLDFSRKDFNKAFSLMVKKGVEATSKWEMKKLGDVFEVIAGQSPESIYYNEIGNGLPFYQGKKDFGKVYLKSPTTWTTRALKKSYKNDILISVRAPVGDVNLNSFSEICIGRGLAALRSQDFNLQKFYFEYININQDAFKGYKGSTFDSISTADLSEIKIPIPPPQVQQSIVNECIEVDDAVNESQQNIQQAKQVIEAKVAEVTRGISTKKLSSLVEIISGGTPSTKHPEYWNGDIPWLSVADFSKGGRFVSTSEKHITNAGLKNSNTRYLNPGDLIISARGTVGAMAQVMVPMTFNQSCYGLRSKDELSNSFLYFVLKQEIKQFLDNATGVKFGAITVKSFENIQIPVPPLSIQQKLVKEIEVIEAQIASAQNVINNAPAKKQEILKKWLE